MKKLLILLCIMLCVTGCGKEETEEVTLLEEETVKVNSNENVIKDQSLNEFIFENTSLVYENNTSTLETTVTNISSSAIFLVEFKIDIKNEDGEVVETLIGLVADNIEAGESRKITSSTSLDLSQSYSLEYSLVE